MGAFIVLEGIDGTGKTTQSRMAADILSSEGFECVVTAEPTTEGVGAVIRSGSAGKLSQRAESLLFIADRYMHTDAIMRDVEQGKVVICDRYYASTLAYQSSRLEGDSVDAEWLESLCKEFVDKPDMVILLDMDPEKSMMRVDSRGEESKFEKLTFQKEVREAYLRLAERYGFRIVDASKSPEEVSGNIMKIIREVL